jgi:RNA polymerase-binding transcription factor DksA
MDAISAAKHYDQLRKRREQVSITLQHIEKEQEEAEQNTDWLDQAAYESRIGLLDCLSRWYIEEMAEIDGALDRIAQNQYGTCQACHNLIGTERLESFPQAVFCSACQATREGLQSA